MGGLRAMARPSSALSQYVRDYQEWLRVRNRAERTVTEYGRLITNALEGLMEAGLEWRPRKIAEDEVDYLHHELYGHLEPHNARWQLSIVGTFCKRVGKNPIVEEMCLEWPEDMRVHARWNSPQKAKRLYDAAQGMERPLIHFELCCLMRRCEVMRLRMQDVQPGRIMVTGKGHAGGKKRDIPWHPWTEAEWDRYLDLRQEIISRADRGATVPDGILIYERNGKLGLYQKTAVDKMIKEAGERAGLLPEESANHINRRSGARILKYSGVPTRNIMKILGHKTEAQTIEYLGLGMDDMTSAFAQGAAYWTSMEA